MIQIICDAEPDCGGPLSSQSALASWSDALHSIFRDKDKIKTKVETTANGVVLSAKILAAPLIEIERFQSHRRPALF